MEITKETIRAGNGQRPSTGNRVTVHYIGRFANGRVFDSSVGRREPLNFNLGKGEVIKGWDEGIAKMSIGEKAILTCPP
jgi:FKBP-type peptidyl-prolyl cis-trans isomerase